MKKSLLFLATLFLTLILSMAMLSATAENNDPSEIVYYDNLEEIGAALRQQLKNRAETCLLGYSGSEELTVRQIWDEALRHTGVPDEGDYLSTCCLGGAFYNEVSEITGWSIFTFDNLTYRTTAEEEQFVNEMIEVISRSIRTDCFDNTLADVMYHSAHITYGDFAGSNDKLRTAYGALATGAAICVGDAHLFYRLAMEFGIETRMVRGIMATQTPDLGHAWDAIKDPTTGLWFYIDPTNDLFASSNADIDPIPEGWSFSEPKDYICSDGFDKTHQLSMVGYKVKIPYIFDTYSGTLTINMTGTIPDKYMARMKKAEDGDILPWSEHLNDIRHIVIPDGVTRIGANLFRDLPNLETVILPESLVEIGDYAFSGCTSLCGVVLPSGVRKIGNYAFSSCTAISSIAYPSGITNTGEFVFQNCENLTDVYLPDSITVIGDGVFDRCTSLANIALPENLHDIGDGAFLYTPIQSIVIPDQVVTIGANAFRYTHLNNIVVPDAVISIGAYAFSDTLLQEIIISENSNLSELGFGAFAYNNSLQTMYLPEGITTVPDELFRGCSALNTVTYASQRIVSIGAGAYRGTNLGSAIIPHGVVSIGEYAFFGCALTAIEFNDELENIGAHAFAQGPGPNSIYIPGKVKSIGLQNFDYTELLEISVALNNKHFTSVNGVLYTKDMIELI